MDDKAALRRQAEEHRRTVELPGFASRIASFADGLNLAPGSVVSGYVAFRDEADPRELLLALAARGARLALPAIVAKGEPLRFHAWQEADVLVPHSYGVMEPHPDCEVVVPDVLLVPLLAFDGAGYRLGYGGGFYDRTLESLRAKKSIKAIGIAYAGQEVVAVPHSAQDQRLDAVLTEEGFRLFV